MYDTPRSLVNFIFWTKTTKLKESSQTRFFYFDGASVSCVDYVQNELTWVTFVYIIKAKDGG